MLKKILSYVLTAVFGGWLVLLIILQFKDGTLTIVPDQEWRIYLSIAIYPLQMMWLLGDD